MATLPIHPADGFSRFPVIGTHPNLPFSSTKLRNRRLRIHHNDWLSEDGMLDTSRSRSASASAAPILHRQMRNATLEGSQTVNILSSPKSLASPKPQSYFSRYYEEDTSNYIPYSSKRHASASGHKLQQIELRESQLQSRIEEISTESFSTKPPKSSFSLQRPRQSKVGSKSFPPMPSSPSSTSLTIARKPVGSALATPSDLFDSSFLGKYDMTLERSVAKAEEVKETPNPLFGSPWDGSIWDEPPPPSPSCRSRSTVSQTSSNTQRSSITSISKQSFAEASSTESLHNPQKALIDGDNEDVSAHGETRPRLLIVCDPFSYFASMFHYLLDAVTAESLQVARDLGILMLKVLLLLYLAACMWSVVAAVHEALLKAFEPLMFLWSFLNWLFGG
jgi:hypothetical protein